ncbi:MAG: lytic transglycosylase domain-containing protein [Polyangiaceae bacterium]|nr:lytic transglycosylase domain-containing protein [Polyangiaceae bacterium]
MTSVASFRVKDLPILVALALPVALLPGFAAADIYSYTDADGVVHFTNKPPSDGRYKLYLKSNDKKDKKSGVGAIMPSDRSVERFTRYDQWIRQAATLYQIPEELIRAVMKAESDYDPRVVSPVGATGLMQLMPETALRMQVRDIHDPRENIFGGVRFLRVLANDLNGDLTLTIAAYNAGEGAVLKYGGVPPYEETQNYVTRVLHYYGRYRATRDVVAASQGE